jgi:hypothetical protein
MRVRLPVVARIAAVTGYATTVGVTNKSRPTPVAPSFVAAANEFCGLLEKEVHPSKQEFLRDVLKATVTLYSAGLDLPDVGPAPGFKPLGEWFEKNKRLPVEEQIRLNPRIQERSRRKHSIRVNIIRWLGGERPYQKVFEPFRDQESISTTLSDDLEDVYCDAKEGLLAMEGSERPSASVVWQWKFGLGTHWGRHAVSAINALHCLSFGSDE